MGVNELYAIPSCQYSGYLDVKHPAGNRGKVAFRVWKRRYVVLNSMTNTLGAPEAKLEIYLSQDEWMAGRGRVPLLPQKPAWIRRCYSRTRAFAFKIQSSTGVVLLYLAGSDETDSQTWMRELRSIYWPRDMKVQPEFLTDSTEISIIDNNFTEQLGLCGSFWLRVGHSEMTLYEPGSEEPRYSWRLRELRRYFVARTQNEKDRNKVFCFTACDANDERSFVFFLQDAESLLRRIEKAQSDLFSTDMPKTSTENLAVKTCDADDDEVESRRSRSNTDSTTISDKSDNSYSSCKNWNNPSARNTMCNTETTGKRWKQSYDYLIRFSRKNPDWRMSDDSHISEDDAEGPLLKEQHSISQWSLTLPRDRLTSAESSPDFGEIGGKFRNQEQGSHGPRRGSAPNNSTRDRRTSGYSNISSSSERPISEFGEYLDMTGIKDDREKPKMESGYLEMSGNFKTSPPQNTPENGTDNITATGLNLNQLQLTIPQTAGRSPISGRGQDEAVSDDDYVPFDEAACAMSNLERRESESSEANFSFSSESGEYEFQESPIFRAKKLRNSGRRKTTRTKIIDELYAPLNDQFDNLTGNIDSLLRESRPKTASPAATEAVEDIESSNEYGAIFTQSPIRLRRESKEPQSSLDSGIIVTSSGSSCSTSTQSSRSNSSYTDENQKTSEWAHDENMYKVIPQTENHYELEDCGQTRHRSDSEDSDTYSMIRSRGNTLTGSDGVYECPSDLIQIQENENILDEDDVYVIFDGDEEENEETKAPPLPQTPIPETPPKAETEMGPFERQMSVTSVSSSNRDSGQSIASGWSVVTSDDVEEVQGSIQNRQRRSGAFSGSTPFMETYPPKAKPKLIMTQQSLQPCEELLESSERSSGESTASEGPERVKKSKDQKKKKSTWTRLIQSKIFSKKDDFERERKRSKSHAAPPDEETEAIAERSRRRSKSDTPPTLHRVGSKTFVKESANPAVSPTSPPVSLRGGSKSSVTFQTPPPVPPRESIPKEIHHRSQSLPDPPDHDYHVNMQKRTTSYPPPPVPPRPSRLSNELKSPPPIPERVFISASHDFKTTQILPNGDKIPKRFTRSPSQDCGKPRMMIRSASEDQGQSQFFPFPSQDLEISQNSDVFHSFPRSRPPPSLPVEASNHVITISKDGSELLDLEPRVRGDSDASVASYASLETVVDALGRSKE